MYRDSARFIRTHQMYDSEAKQGRLTRRPPTVPQEHSRIPSPSKRQCAAAGGEEVVLVTF